MKKHNTKDDTKPMSILSLILSFMALFVISGLLFVPMDHETRQVLIGLDFMICSIFMLQWLIDLIRSTNRKKFMQKYWIDLLASIPMIEPLRYARLFHILRVILVIRSGRTLLNQLTANRKETTLASILFLMVVLITLGSTIMLRMEQSHPDANIQSAGDALWWALVTISTVGYGDHFPVSDGGKLLASALILSGVGLFGMISGLITSMLTSPTRDQTQRSENKEKLLLTLLEQQTEVLKRLEALEQKVKEKQ